MTTERTLIFRTQHAPGLRFELRPVATAPERTVGILYRRNGGRFTQCGVGSNLTGEWKDGKNKPLETDGLYWAEMFRDGE